MRSRSLKQIIKSSIAAIIIIYAAFLFFNYLVTKITLLQIEEEKINTIVTSYGSDIAKLYTFGFHRELQEILSKIKEENPFIREIRIDKTQSPYSYPLRYEQKTVGYLHIRYDHRLEKRFFQKYFTSILFISIGLVLILTLILGYLYKKIGSLERLSHLVEKIDPKSLRSIPYIDNYKEISTITDAINKLLSTIHDYVKRLRRNQEHLIHAQHIAKLASWEYDVRTGTFFPSSQLLTLLGIDKKHNLSFKEFLGYLDPLDAKLLVEKIQFLASSKQKSTELVVKYFTPQKHYFKVMLHLTKESNAHKIFAIAQDITEEYQAKEKMKFLAFYDPLTNLPNRAAFNEQIPIIHALAKRNNQKYAVLFLDLDNFKEINDTYGHDIGDELLQKVAREIKETLRSSDSAYRLGGDEFVIVLSDIKRTQDIQIVARKLLNTIAREYSIEKKEFSIGCSIGAALYPIHSEDPQELVRYADIAMYEAKQRGKNRFVLFDRSMKDQFFSRQLIANEIKKALQNEEFVLYLQPQFDCYTKKIYGVEVLIRWIHPQKGVVPPAKFIPIAEESHLITQIDEYVLRRVFALRERWSNIPELSKCSISFNLSAKEFFNEDLIPLLEKMLQMHKIDPSKITIEVTETASMEDVEFSLHQLNEIKKLGFKIALDDFGTGYSSLNYLKKIPFDYLKIDRSFIVDIDKDQEDLTLVKLIVDIGNTFGKITLAEGVETKKQERLLKELGCIFAQGYLYAKPIPTEEFEAFVKKWPKHSSNA